MAVCRHVGKRPATAESVGVLRVGYALNGLIASTLKGK